MKLAIIGSRSITRVNIEQYVNGEITEIVSGGAFGVDSIAKAFAMQRKIKYTEFLPKYSVYGRAAPLKRNEEIAEYADAVLALWDGCSKGTEYTVNCFKRLGKKVYLIKINFG